MGPKSEAYRPEESDMRRPAHLIATLATATAIPLMHPAMTVTAAAHDTGTRAPYCGIRWGSLPEEARGISPVRGPITSYRAARHDCFDRFVVDIQGRDLAGFDVRYVPAVVGTEGRAIPVRGNADLQLTIFAPAYKNGAATVRGVPSVRGFEALKEIRQVESFEGVTLVALGTRGRLPFRVFTLTGPDNMHRLVIDVAHSW